MKKKKKLKKSLKKIQNSPLNFILCKIKKHSLRNIKNFNYNFIAKKKLFITHNKKLFLPRTFDIVTFFKKSKKSKKKKSKELYLLIKKKKNKILYDTFFLKVQKVKYKKKLNLYLKFVSFVFKTGNFFFWEKAFALIFSNLSLKFHYSRSLILAKIFIRLFTRVELKKVKSRKRITYIPFFIKFKRSVFLALKWIFLGAFCNMMKVSFQNKLYIEIVQILSLRSCFSLKKLEENNINSFNNRSNIHYRWKRNSI
jgi:hypothetical protein